MKIKSVYLLAIASACTFSLAGCNNNNDGEKEFDFSIALESGKVALEIGSYDQILINTTGTVVEGTTYTYKSSNENRATVSETGYVAAVGKGNVTFTVTAEIPNKTPVIQTLQIQINDVSELASGGFNYSAQSGTEANKQREEILGKLEKYAVESHLTGITLFENGGYVKYRDRLDIPAKEYITGYGFGILSEGDIKSDLAAETVEEYKRYYHSAQTSNPNTINAWNATGSQVSDLNGYITSSYWGTKMNEDKDGYDWYPVLAADKVGDEENLRPIPVYDEVNPLGLYKTWKIYVKTGDNANLKYRYSGTTNAEKYENRKVALEDYAFVYQLLLTGANKQTRGAEMAGDKTYGIKGAQSYYTKTKDMTDQVKIDATWKEMTKTNDQGKQDPAKFSEQSLGILVGSDDKGDYIQLELINEIDKFTAMYTLSSNLYSPIPREFIEDLAPEKTVVKGILNYGKHVTATNKTLVDNTISLGAYKLDKWIDEYIAFGKNYTWVENDTYPNRNKIKGIKITTYKAASQEDLYTKFYAGVLDSCGIPIDHIDEEADQPDVRSTKGDSTFKLNVNSCTQERWDELFGKNGEICQNSSWNVKPWMSNEDFLNGLYWSIDRAKFASNRGMQPSINYFADAYLSDPEAGISYNDSEAHKAAISKWHTVRTIDGKKVDNYGYDYDKAVECFRKAVNTLASSGKLTLGSPSNKTPVDIHIRWMYSTDQADYGNEIAAYFKKAFDDERVCGGCAELIVTQEAVTNWEDVYNEWMMKGQFDLAFGAISGNTYNPLNFLEVLKSDNSSGFTLNWGPNTHEVDEKNPLIYDGKKWSFDALWEVADHGGVVENGVSQKTVKKCYLDGLAKDLATGSETNDYSNGAEFDIVVDYINVENVEVKTKKVEIYVAGGSSYEVSTSNWSYDKETKKLHVRLPSDVAQAIKAEMIEVNNVGLNPGDAAYNADPFVRSQYDLLWTVDITYTFAIKGGTPSQNVISAAKSETANVD